MEEGIVPGGGTAYVNVINKVAELHHGGGHKMASGVRVKTLDEALEVMRDLDNELKKYNDEGEE